MECESRNAMRRRALRQGRSIPARYLNPQIAHSRQQEIADMIRQERAQNAARPWKGKGRPYNREVDQDLEEGPAS